MQGVIRAFIANQQSGKITGAPTLTQQYVKNILKYSAKTKAEREAAEADTPARSARCAVRRRPGEEVLQGADAGEVPNIAFFGNGGNGAASAAKVYSNSSSRSTWSRRPCSPAGEEPDPVQPYGRAEVDGKAKDRRDYVLQAWSTSTSSSGRGRRRQEDANRARPSAPRSPAPPVAPSGATTATGSELVEGAA